MYGEEEVLSNELSRSPASFYSVAKIRGENHVLCLMDKLSVQLVRCTYVYGYCKNIRMESEIYRLLFDAPFNNRISIYGCPNHEPSYINLHWTVEILVQIVLDELLSDIFSLSHSAMSTYEVVQPSEEFYPDLETIFVDEHMPREKLTVTCDERLQPMLPLETSKVQEVTKIRELFIFVKLCRWSIAPSFIFIGPQFGRMRVRLEGCEP